MDLIRDIISNFIPYLQTINVGVALLIAFLMYKAFGKSIQTIMKVIVLYVAITYIGQIYGFEVPTYLEIIEWVKNLGSMNLTIKEM